MKYASIVIVFFFHTALAYPQANVSTEPANNEWIGLLDTAIKIGLGAAVASIGAIVLAKINAKKERDTEFLKRKRDRIEQVSRDLEQTHAKIIDLHATNGTILLAIEQDREIGEKWIIQLHQLEDDFKKAFETIHILEGTLALIECDEAKKEMETYRSALTELSQNIAWIPSAEFKGKLKEVDSSMHKIQAARKKLYLSIRDEYKKA